MAGTEDELYQDIASDEAVRPSVTTGGGNSPSGLQEGEPEYHLYRDEAVDVPASELLENPNLVATGGELNQGQDRRGPSHSAEPYQEHPATLTAEPPYEQMLGREMSEDANTGFSQDMREKPKAGVGKGARLHPEPHRRSPQAGDVSLRTGPGGGFMPQTGPVINGTSRQTGMDGTWNPNALDQGAEGVSTSQDVALQALVTQLLRQNAALHQELLDARMSSGSGSNVSQEGRVEGRGTGRVASQIAGVPHKGKGIGTETGRTFTPPWTSFAVDSGHLTAFQPPLRDSNLYYFHSQQLPAVAMPPQGPQPQNVEELYPRPLLGALSACQPSPAAHDMPSGAAASRFNAPVPQANPSPSMGEVATGSVATQQLREPTAGRIPVPQQQQSLGVDDLDMISRPVQQPPDPTAGRTPVLQQQQSHEVGGMHKYATTSRGSERESHLNDERIPLQVVRWSAQVPSTSVGNTHSVRDAVGEYPASRHPESVQTGYPKPPTSQDKPVCPVPPSIAELGPPAAVTCMQPPPLPKFSSSRGRRQTIQLVVDGERREGYVDESGQIQLDKSVHFMIGSDDEADPLPRFGERTPAIAANPFVPGARSPFSESPGQKSTVVASEMEQEPRENHVPPPPPVVEGWGKGSRRRSPSPRTPTNRRTGWNYVTASPATLGGTKVPSGPPPPSPPPISAALSCESTPAKTSPSSETYMDQSNDRDFVPGERTMWELPKLGPTTEPQPAMRCNDWLHRIKPSIHDLAPKAYAWWAVVMKEAREAYDNWCSAGPLERAAVRGQPSSYLKSEGFVRLESRTLAMLSKALPHTIYELALSARNTTCTGLIFLTLRTYQPGGLHERSELLRGLTSLQVAGTAAVAVSTLQAWFRHLERARSMNIAVPDSSLLIDGLDKMINPLLEKHPNLLFRTHSIRMQLQLDTIPSMQAVEQWARSLLAEMEILAVSGSDPTPPKRTRVAALAGKGKETPSPTKPEVRKADAGGKDPCKHWATETGCRRGRNCNFSHALEKPGKCWTCGGNHTKSECHAPGGGKAKPKAAATPKDGTKGSGKQPQAKTPSPAASSSEATAALKEATHLLQSLRLARVRADSTSVTQLRRLAEAEGANGLIDGGATACLRTASSEELKLPTIAVQLAAGECQLHINHAGTLLSKSQVAPIVSVAALLKLGYSLTWTNQRCEVSHPIHGQLKVDTSSGCPEVPASIALDLIRDYEALVGKKQVREVKVKKMVEDMSQMDDSAVVSMLRSESTESEAALRVLLSRRLPTVSQEVLEQLVTPIQEACEGHTWNRRARRKHAREQGLLLHVFCGKSRSAFEQLADKHRLAHLAIDTKENLLRQSTYQHLMLQAVRSRVRFIIGGPPCRTNSVCRYLPLSDHDSGPRPVRVRGSSICEMDHDYLSGTEVAMRQIDDLLYLRFLVLFVVATECNRQAHVPDPGFGIEQPEDPECWAKSDLEWSGTHGNKLTQFRPETGFATFWSTPEWEGVCKAYNLKVLSFDQGPLLHPKRKPTSLGTNMNPAAELLDCRGPGVDSWISGSSSINQSKTWAEWSPGLVAALGYMMEDWIQLGHKMAHQALKKMDPSFIEHIRQQHVPYRRDCKYCVQGGAKQRQHRRVLSPQMWTLSVDTAGPFAIAQDESTKNAKYFVIGVLTIPKYAATKPVPPDDPCEPAPDAAEDDEDEDIARLLDAAEWLADGEGDHEAEKPASPKEVETAREAWKHWLELVEGDQASWKKEAECQYLPKAEAVDWVFLEPVATKNSSDVLTAIGKMYAAAKAEGFDVRRVHSDRGREFTNSQCRTWCARHGLHKTFALPEEHQSNGRAEGAIMRAKSRIRTILRAAGSGPQEWPLAARLAAHTMRNIARRKLNMPLAPSVPFNAKVQVLQRSWNRGVWESVTMTAYTKAPSGDSTRGWIVKTSDGRLLTTGTLFPSPKDEHEVEIKCQGRPVAVSEPERRIRGKTSLRSLQADTQSQLGNNSPKPWEEFASMQEARGHFCQTSMLQVLTAASLGLAGYPTTQGWFQKTGVIEHQGIVDLAGCSMMPHALPVTLQRQWTITVVFLWRA